MDKQLTMQGGGTYGQAVNLLARGVGGGGGTYEQAVNSLTMPCGKGGGLNLWTSCDLLTMPRGGGGAISQGGGGKCLELMDKL